MNSGKRVFVGGGELFLEIEMQAVTRYMANDGSEWSCERDAFARDEMILEVAEAATCLKAKPEGINWDGYVQHSKETVLEFKRKLFAIANREGVLKWWIDGQKSTHGRTEKQLIEETHPSWFDRMLDGAHQPLESCYCRLMCIDDQFREWNQPYFASHPEEAKNVCVG